MIRRRLVLPLLALAAFTLWLSPPRVAIIRQGNTRGLWIGPGDRPFLIVARTDSANAVWVGGFLAPPGPLGCDWAVCLYDDAGMAAQYHGRLYELLPARAP